MSARFWHTSDGFRPPVRRAGAPRTDEEGHRNWRRRKRRRGFLGARDAPIPPRARAITIIHLSPRRGNDLTLTLILILHTICIHLNTNVFICISFYTIVFACMLVFRLRPPFIDGRP
ncbi:MAG: hypothetical protein IJ783_11305, partial [Kiritimatiellae bacterium]|nr:hypothetical protein [Kiritimatiellia bacterium]